MKNYSKFLFSANRSPSMRREWIEIFNVLHSSCIRESPSMRREWIEMQQVFRRFLMEQWSPSMRREWIEITYCARFSHIIQVSLHAEGVD